MTTEIRWLEDDPITEWEPLHLERMTNARGSLNPDQLVIDMFPFQPTTLPSIIVTKSNFTQIRRSTRFERIGFAIQRWRRALALRVDPSLVDELEGEDLW